MLIGKITVEFVIQTFNTASRKYTSQDMLGENVERHLKSDAHWVPIPICPFCDEELDGPTTSGLHRGCDEKFHAEMEETEHHGRGAVDE